MRNEAFMFYLFLSFFLKFSLLNLVEDMWSKSLSNKVFPAFEMCSKCGVNCTM